MLDGLLHTQPTPPKPQYWVQVRNPSTQYWV